MPLRTPIPSDFPQSLIFTLTPPPPPPPPTTTPKRTPPNILLLLHGLGDTQTPFTTLAKSLLLPETTILTIQAPHPLPFNIPGFHWGDDITFDSRSGALDMDAGFARATELILSSVIRGVLVRECGYAYSEILVWGFGQGGMVGLEVLGSLGSLGEGEGEGGGELGGVISIGAGVSSSFPASSSSSKKKDGTVGKGKKNRTPVLLVSGRDSEVVTDAVVGRTRDVFEFVEVHTYAKKGDSMPRDREEMMPIMRFLGRRLRSWRGVPEGSVEVL